MNVPTDWQSIAALGIVLVTVLLFVMRALRNRGKVGCSSCGSCPVKPKALGPSRTSH